MRTITITKTLYRFEELTAKAKENAIDSLRYINVNYEWWDSTYEDAKNIGLKLTLFGLDRNKHAEGELISSASETAYLIMDNHGEKTETYKLAKEFLSNWNALVEKYSDGINKNRVTEENQYEFDAEVNELEKQFTKDLLEEYACMLQREYDYQTSDEAIIETINANEYEFTEEGEYQ